MIGDYSNPKYGYDNNTPGNRFLKRHHHTTHCIIIERIAQTKPEWLTNIVHM